MEDLPGFANPNGVVDMDDDSDEKIVKKGPKKGSGGFQSLGLSFGVLKGITKKGYKQPTPIQRKTIPLALEGRDIVAMARTGSGKTACFLIPLLEKLKMRSGKAGARALIFSPTRELALQTLKFIKEIGRFTNLKAAVILGGDSMSDQFAAIHGSPDIIVATPGRFMHVCVEMELKLNSVEYVVFDEADRLFEMGLGQQLTEVISRLPDARQTLLFSATLPKVLVEFAKAGLNDPILIRLDIETKIPEELQLNFITVRAEEKLAALLVLLNNHISQDEKTIIFAATKYHVEYLHMALELRGHPNAYIYSSLDPTARKIHAAKFSKGKVKLLVVTDVAARGLDIPQLDNVINFDFPPKSKLFVHRVGRCARAGRSGSAYSLVMQDEYAYLLDLHLFLGRPLLTASADAERGTIGKVPQALLSDENASLVNLHDYNYDLVGLKKVCDNAYKQYIRTRPKASSESFKRMKILRDLMDATHHPIFDKYVDEVDKTKEEWVKKINNWRGQTLLEKSGSKETKEMMRKRRLAFDDKIKSHQQMLEREQQNFLSTMAKQGTESDLPKSSGDDIDDAFQQVVMPKKRKFEQLYEKNKRFKKNDNFIPYYKKDRYTEQGLAVNFQNEASKVQLDLAGDSEELMKRNTQTKKWDRKKKKMVGVPNQREGKIKTEAGVWIPASYKRNIYAQWKQKVKNVGDNENAESEDTSNVNPRRKPNTPNTHWAKHNEKVKQKQRKSELKTTDQILKNRKIAEKKKNRQKKKGKGKKKGRRQ